MISLLLSLLLLINAISSEAKTYSLKVRTSKWPPWSGTSEDIVVTLFGTKGKNVSKRFSGWGLDLLENGQTNSFSIDGEDIGSIVKVQAGIIQDGKFFDDWRLFWIQVDSDGDRFKATFEHTFTTNGETTSAKIFEVLHCRSGFQPTDQGVMTCLDRNECLVTCKEPGQSCTNLPGTFKCECRKGFYVEGTTCKDYDECAMHHRNPCNYPNAKCVNLPGKYECQCKKGYQGDYYACKDKDECQLGHHGCSQKCINTPGSYKCGCKPGFKLAVDGVTCLDVDECKGVNSCNATTSVCYDEYGSHRCVCKLGYRETTVDANGIKKKICVPVECQPFQRLDEGVQLSPSRCLNGKNFFGDECSVTCADGYDLDTASARKFRCSRYGFARISGAMPKCNPRPCPPLKVPNFGYTVPLGCSSSGTTQGRKCYIYCDQGFNLAGRRTYTCNQQKFDHDSSTSLCTKTPKIDCPKNVRVKLPAQKGRVALGNDFPFYKTNLRQDQITSNIQGVGPSYQFPVGSNVIVYTATNEINQTDKCSFVIQVIDETPPEIDSCPSSMTFVTKGVKPVNVTWKEPKFKDNVAIRSVHVQGQNGIMRSPVAFIVRYMASDTSGNLNSCQFTVYFKILRCDFKSIRGGDNMISSGCFSMGDSSMCFGQCTNEQTFDVINSKNAMKFIWSCKDGEFDVDRLPDCVDFVEKKEDCAKGYKEVEEYRTMIKVCAKCPRGTYYNNGSCDECPLNTFQASQGSFSCEKCKVGHGTISTRSKVASDCRPLCPLGYASSNGLSDGTGSCKMCPFNTYADKHGSTMCKKCPIGTATRGQGRTNIADCLFAPKNIRMMPAGTLEVSVGEKVQFDCLAEGSPLPFLLIRKQKGDANPSTHSLLPLLTSRPMTKGRRYFISKATIHDSGTYVCKAESIKGNALASLQLVVTEGSGMGESL